jgi:hypothetical protein
MAGQGLLRRLPGHHPGPGQRQPVDVVTGGLGRRAAGGVPEPRHPGGESFGGRLGQAPGWHPGGGGGAAGRPRPQAYPGRRFGLGTAAFAAVNIAVAGAAETARWLGSLFEFTATLDPGQSKVAGQCCLAGLPALLLDRTSLPIAVAAAALFAGALLLVAHRRGLFGAGRPDSLCGLATLTALALVVTPYVHLNDLVLEALPVLVIASQPLSSLSRVVLVLWGLGSATALAAGGLVAALGGGGTPRVSGFGLALGVLTAVAPVTIRPKAASTPAAPTQPAAAPV